MQYVDQTWSLTFLSNTKTFKILPNPTVSRKNYLEVNALHLIAFRRLKKTERSGNVYCPYFMSAVHTYCVLWSYSNPGSPHFTERSPTRSVPPKIHYPWLFSSQLWLFICTFFDGCCPPTHTLLILVTAGTMPLAYLYVWFHKVLPVPTKNNIIYSRWLIYIC